MRMTADGYPHAVFSGFDVVLKGWVLVIVYAPQRSRGCEEVPDIDKAITNRDHIKDTDRMKISGLGFRHLS